MSVRAHRVVGWVVIAFCAVVAIVMINVGWIIDGIGSPDSQCISAPVPELGGPFTESTRMSGQRSILPLGVDCTYDVDGDAFGPQIVHNYRVGPNVVFLVSLLGIAAGALVLVRGRLLARVNGL